MASTTTADASAANAAMYAWKPKTNPWLIAATVALAAFMEVLDTSIANVALPHIAGTLGGWITDNYSWHWIFYINIPVGIFALFLTNRLVEDPPYQKADRKNLYRIDYIGVSLLVVAMGALQITLDKGEEKNWFGSNFIMAFALTFII